MARPTRGSGPGRRGRRTCSPAARATRSRREAYRTAGRLYGTGARLPGTSDQPLAIDRILAILVPAIMPGRISPGETVHVLLHEIFPSKITMCVRLPAARSGPAAPTASTPLPESPGVDGPYHAYAVPLRAVQIGATPARAVPPVP